ncbi:MAG: ABC transporter permease [Phototrophicaceae bacterium]|jgi:simple sugar transport system permease protein
MNEALIAILAGVVRNATPLVIASIGETLTERAGVTNLSLDGSIILSAMTGFVVALLTESILFGVLAAMFVGALVALIIAVADIELRQDQVAIGFVLTLLCRDIAQFVGQAYTRLPGPQIPNQPIPFLSQIPVLGTIFFDHDWTVYLSYVLVIGTWWFLFASRAGLAARAVGERPEAAFARGTPVNAQRYLYTILGGALVGLAGAAYSLRLKPGWATPPNMLGDGWIALAIVIFGGWNPLRVLLGAYLFAGLRSLSSALQRSALFPVTLLNLLPWVLMILTLVLVNGGALERLTRFLPRPIARRVQQFLRSDPPAALGTRFER